MQGAVANITAAGGGRQRPETKRDRLTAAVDEPWHQPATLILDQRRDDGLVNRLAAAEPFGHLSNRRRHRL